MTNLLSPSECGVRKHHLCLTAHGFKSCGRFDRSLYSHLWFTLVYPVTYTVLTNCSVVISLCYTVLCRITNGPFDQEVISSSLTLEDPDLKVSLVPSSNFISQIESDPAHLVWQEKSLKTPDPPLAQTIYWGDMTCSHYRGVSFFVQAILASSTTRKNKKKKVFVTILVCICVGVDRGALL